MTGTGGDDIITVDATTTDPNAAFDILERPGEGDDQITVGIGTEVTMSEYDWLQSTDAQDSDTGTDDVTVVVSEGRLDQIGQDWTGDGEQAGWVDLTDEKDSLDFEFDDDVTGNFHLVRMDEQSGGGSSDFSSQYAWVVRTDEDVTDVQGNDWADAFLGLNDTPPAPFQFVAGIDLGEYLSRMTNEDDANGYPVIDQWDDQNSDPMITTNRAWTSVSTIVV